MDGENGDFEYGGSTKASEKSFSPKDEIKYWFSGFDAKKWLNKGYKKEELDVYMRPSFKEIMKKLIGIFGVTTISGTSRTFLLRIKIYKF